MDEQKVKFGDGVEIQESGVTYNALVVKAGFGGVIDVIFAKPIFSGDGAHTRSVGSSRQAEIVQWRHDLKPGEYRLAEDWFFTLTDGELAQLINERERRREAAENSAAEQHQKAAKAKRLDGLKITPRKELIEKARELWLEDLVQSGHLAQHETAEFPTIQERPDLWEPWIVKAKAAIAAESEQNQQVVDRVSDSGAAGGDPGPGTVQ